MVQQRITVRAIGTALLMLGLATPTNAQSDNAPAPVRTYLVFLDYEVPNLTEAATEVVKAAAESYRQLGATRIDLTGNTDTAEADISSWHHGKDYSGLHRNWPKYRQKYCRKASAKIRSQDPECWPAPNAKKLGLLRAQAVADELVGDGVPRKAIQLSSDGAADPLVPTPPATREPQNRRVVIKIY